jgi:thiamine-monophosphate kinase
MKLSELGEREIIKILRRNFEECDRMLVSIGDDASVYDLDGENCLVVSMDVISQKEHIPVEMTPRQIGMYVVNVNLSDLASMGAQPIGIVTSLGLPGDLEDIFIKELSSGINEACSKHGICVLGGDTKEMREISIACTALGMAKKGKFLTRSGARVGDLICVTGKIGSAAAGFYCLIENLKEERFIKAALEPKARIREGLLLAGYANSCMDISDGLAFSLHEISRASKVGFKVYEEKIPIDPRILDVAEKAGVSSRELIFHKGGDYELLFTIPPEKLKEIKLNVNIIGEVIPAGAIIVNPEGMEETLSDRGYESFKS